MIECAIYTQATKEKVIKPSQWKDDMYISLTWDADSDGLRLCADCGDVEVRAPRRFCSSCATQHQIDND